MLAKRQARLLILGALIGAVILLLYPEAAAVAAPETASPPRSDIDAIRTIFTRALAGFLLITWSASFTFIEMQRFWRQD